MAAPTTIHLKPQTLNIPPLSGGTWPANPGAFPAPVWTSKSLGVLGVGYRIGGVWRGMTIADTVNFLRAPDGGTFMTVDLQRYPPTQPFHLAIRRAMASTSQRLDVQLETPTNATAVFPETATHISRTSMASLFRDATGLGIRNEHTAEMELLLHGASGRTRQMLAPGEAVAISHGTTYCSLLVVGICFLQVRLPQNTQAFLACDKNELGIGTVLVGPPPAGLIAANAPASKVAPAKVAAPPPPAPEQPIPSPTTADDTAFVAIDKDLNRSAHNAQMLNHARHRFDAVSKRPHTILFGGDQRRHLPSAAVKIYIDRSDGKILSIVYSHQGGSPLNSPRYISYIEGQEVANEGDPFTFLVDKDGSLRYHELPGDPELTRTGATGTFRVNPSMQQTLLTIWWLNDQQIR